MMNVWGGSITRSDVCDGENNHQLKQVDNGNMYNASFTRGSGHSSKRHLNLEELVLQLMSSLLSLFHFLAFSNEVGSSTIFQWFNLEAKFLFLFILRLYSFSFYVCEDFHACLNVYHMYAWRCGGHWILWPQEALDPLELWTYRLL